MRVFNWIASLDYAAAFKSNVTAKVARWILYTVIVSMLPFLFDYAAELIKKHGKFPTYTSVIEHGELCIVATAFAGVGLGEIIGLSDTARIAKIVLGGLCLISALLMSVLYFIMKSQLDPETAEVFIRAALVLFCETLLVSTISVAISEWKK